GVVAAGSFDCGAAWLFPALFPPPHAVSTRRKATSMKDSSFLRLIPFYPRFMIFLIFLPKESKRFQLLCYHRIGIRSITSWARPKWIIMFPLCSAKQNNGARPRSKCNVFLDFSRRRNEIHKEKKCEDGYNDC